MSIGMDKGSPSYDEAKIHHVSNPQRQRNDSGDGHQMEGSCKKKESKMDVDPFSVYRAFNEGEYDVIKYSILHYTIVYYTVLQITRQGGTSPCHFMV